MKQSAVIIVRYLKDSEYKQRCPEPKDYVISDYEFQTLGCKYLQNIQGKALDELENTSIVPMLCFSIV